MFRQLVLSLALLPSLAQAASFSIARPKLTPTCIGGSTVAASDGTQLCVMVDDKGNRTITGTDRSGAARKATVTHYNGPTSTRVDIQYFTNGALQLTMSHLLLGSTNEQIAVTDPSNFSARFELLSTTAYFYEVDETGQRFGEVYGAFNPDADGDAKYPPHFFDEFRANWQPLISNLGEYFAPAIDEQMKIIPYNKTACGVLSAIAAELACDTGGIIKRTACKETFKALLEDMCNYLDTVGPTIGGAGGGAPNSPGASVGGNTGSGGGGKGAFDSKDCSGQTGNPCP